MTEQYDLVIIGSGPGGYVAAIRAGQLGLKTAVIERDLVGGTCLNRGCIPTKSLLQSAAVYRLVREGGDFGVEAQNVVMDWTRAQKRKEQDVARLRKGVEALLKKNQATVIRGNARLKSSNEVTIEPADGDTVTIPARHVLVAVGAQPKTLLGIAIDEDRILSSTGIMQLDHIPESLAIIGAGAIGVEFGYLFQTLGTKVMLLEALPHILPLEDAEVAQALTSSFKKGRMRVEAGARVEKVVMAENGVQVFFATADGKQETVAVERLLMAVGRGPATADLGLEGVGIRTERGAIVVDEFQRTNVPTVYAIGDCTPTLQLAHVASAQGILAVEHIAGRNPRPLNCDHMPRCTYCHPEVASVGITEAQAAERGYTVRTAKFPFLANSRAVILGEREGFVKMVVDEAYDAVLGVQVIGPSATELIAEAALALHLECTAEEFSRTVHPHPTLSEALMETAHAAIGMPIHY